MNKFRILQFIQWDKTFNCTTSNYIYREITIFYISNIEVTIFYLFNCIKKIVHLRETCADKILTKRKCSAFLIYDHRNFIMIISLVARYFNRYKIVVKGTSCVVRSQVAENGACEIKCVHPRVKKSTRDPRA